MKKTILLSALAVAATMTAGAKNADELRVYINPGHGSWTGGDRAMTVVGHKPYDRYNTDTTNFFESNTNLRKGFGVLERLIDYGLKFDRTLNQTGERWQIGAARDMSNNIVMSHVKCGPYHDDNGTSSQLGANAPKDIEYYNRNLSEICQEVDANNFDMFISIHSNAATEGTTTNYPLYLYRGYDTPSADEYNNPSDGSEPIVILSNEHQVQSRKMADMSWGYAIGNPHAVWTAYTSSKNLRGDINFYGSSSVSGYTFTKGYLGVLKHHVPGFLVEGYFHTYQPARHRAMNWDVCRVEGIAYARGIADYFGLDKEKFGTIYGIVRDQHEKFAHEYYRPNPLSNDIFLPINGCKVILKKDGQVVAEYTTDDYYNGAYVFDRVEPGKYTIEFSHPDYKPAEPVEVEVKAATDTYPTTSLENVNWAPPTVDYTDYPDPAAKLDGREPASEYAVEAVYTDEPIAELEGKIVRRSIVRDGKMYVLAIDKLPTYAQVVSDEDKPVPTIIVYDLNEKKVLANVSTEGAYGSIQNVSDIQVSADGYLLASNQTKTQYSADYQENLPDGTKEPRGTFYIYKWANDENGLPTGNPEQWLNTQQSGRWFRAYAGGTFAYAGTTVDGKAIVPMPTITAPTYNFRWTSITVANGMQAGAADILNPASNPNETAMGTGYRYITSPVNTENFLTAGPGVGMVERKFNMEDKVENLSAGNDELTGIPGTVGMFRYAGASYVVAPESKDGNNVGLRLINITNNIANAVSVPLTGVAITPAEVANVATAGEVESTIDIVDYT
ncbi:MAG: carboxypeptidase-like regulatory domain-containing protein, partial [Muribaculaceae bacterium]|nr:carboxypeptidase-like regulatory domain-containing protein [Muribaculaceae bacterium]